MHSKKNFEQRYSYQHTGRKRHKFIPVVLCVFLIVTVIAIAQQVTIHRSYKQGYTDGVEQARAEMQAQLAYEAQQAAAARAASVITYADGTTYEQLKTEAESIAQVLYAMRNNTRAGLKLAVWCVINRSINQSYPDAIVDVCIQPMQWMGYDEGNPILQELYEICYEELIYWHNGGHVPMDLYHVFLSWSEKEIVLFTDYERKGSCHYFYESDWEKFEQSREV